MKFRNGTYKPWSEDASARASMESAVLLTYYGFYAFLLVLAFLVLPLAFFYEFFRPSEEEDAAAAERRTEDGEAEAEAVTTSRLWSAIKWTSVCVMTFAGLVLVGVFVPWGDVQPNLVIVDAYAASSTVGITIQLMTLGRQLIT